MCGVGGKGGGGLKAMRGREWGRRISVCVCVGGGAHGHAGGVVREAVDEVVGEGQRGKHQQQPLPGPSQGRRSERLASLVPSLSLAPR